MKDPKFIEFKAKHDAATKSSGVATSNSMYFGYDEKLKSIFSDGTINSQTPKSEGFASKKEYVAVLNDWLSKNKHLLKSEHKNSLISE